MFTGLTSNHSEVSLLIDSFPVLLWIDSGGLFSSVQLLNRVWLFATPWIAARQASLSITNSWSSLKLTCIKLVMPSSHLILCRPLLLLPSIPPSIRVFSNESTLRMRWPKYWSFSFSIIPSRDRKYRFNPWFGKIPWRRKWQPTSVFLPGKFHGQRNLEGHSPWGHKELDTTYWVSNNNKATTITCAMSIISML